MKNWERQRFRPSKVWWVKRDLTKKSFPFSYKTHYKPSDCRKGAPLYILYILCMFVWTISSVCMSDDISFINYSWQPSPFLCAHHSFYFHLYLLHLFIPPISVLFLRHPRPFYPPLSHLWWPSSSPPSLPPSVLFFPLHYSALTFLPCFIKAFFQLSIPPSPRKESVSLSFYQVPVRSFFSPFTQPWACCRRCTRWMSGEHIRICAACVCVLGCWDAWGGEGV